MRAFRSLVSGLRMDSTRHWELQGDRLRISYDLLQDLAAGQIAPSGGTLGGKLADFLLRNHGIAFQPSGSAHGDYLPDDEWLVNSPQWALHNAGVTIAGRPGKVGVDIDIEKVWDKFSGSDSLVVAVVDAGFDFNHPDLKGRNWINKGEAGGKPGFDDDGNGYVDDSLGWDFVENDNLPQDRHGHGTFVSSVIAAGFDNQIGVAGILAQGKIMPVRVLDASGHGDQADIAKGILYAVRNGAKVINFSIGGDGDNLSMRSAFQTAHDAGVPIVVAAGNDGLDINVTPAYPASYTYDNMLVVAAHDHQGLLSPFSNFGKTAVHLAAPGELILVCGVADPIQKWNEDFEKPALAWDTTVGGWALGQNQPVAGAQSLVWKAGNNVTATMLDTLDLTGIQGASLQFRIDFDSANASDAVLIEGNKIGSATWTEIAVMGGKVSPLNTQSYGLQDVELSKVRLRIRTSLASRFSPSKRVLKIDDIRVLVPNPVPPAEPVYSVVAGTSLAAPHVTAYVALQRLACDRMGLAWNRSRALTGVVAESAFTNKMTTGGRLDAYKGLQFYLSTLPDFHVLDSTAVTWKGGEQVDYSLVLSPPPAANYVLTETGLPKGAGIDGAGKLTWTPNPSQAGNYSVRIFASGPTVLRKVISFTVQPPLPVALAGIGLPGGGRWTVAGQAFALPARLNTGRHLMEISATDAAGRVKLLKRAWLDAPGLAPAPAEFADSPEGFRHWRIRADGIPLASAR